ncbi:MAG: competence/damage-inducible protein A [Alcaligenaceae bacterium]|nr:competence/damage-inducible protein A [Alcaligenaceae bacterium]
MNQDPPKIRLIIIGDEILSGRRQDKHMPHLIQLLAARGMQLNGVEIISDGQDEIAAVLQRSFATGDIVFCCGGIGSTPDDRTRQAAAQALGVGMVLHPEAERLITERCADHERAGKGSADMSLPENQLRLQMGVFPLGSDIVPNSYNKIPGFFIRDHTFMPGFPVIAWPMMEWTLDHRYSSLHHRVDRVEHSFVAFEMPESRITPALEEIEKHWPEVQAFSLPSMGQGRPHIDLGVKGEPAAAALALSYLREEVLRLGGELHP